MVAGIVTFCFSIFSVIWIFQRKIIHKHKLRKRNPNDILNLLLFICHGLKAIHVITLVCVDFAFHGYYALHEEKWKRHPLCILLNMLLYTLVLVTMFLSLLSSYARMMACAFPFHLLSVKLAKMIWAAVIFLSVTLCVSYLPHSGIDGSHVNEPHHALGFSLVLPVIKRGQPMWSVFGYVFPMTTMLMVSCAFQITSIRVLLKKPRQLETPSMSLSNRRRSAARCIVILILPLCCHIPLLVLHIAAASGVELRPYLSVVVMLSTLTLYSILDAILYVVITPVFIDFSLRCLRCN